ncbi:MAG: hypothetical protein GF353_10730 [Candidatus Lokiarchaeota archaeon]|nr:hypothetical protein [Candidatus Lokiarchaeota archaeon]
MGRDVILTEKVEKFAKKIGIDLIGFADPAHFERYKKRYKPFKFLKDAQTVIVLGVYMYDLILDAWSQDLKSGRGSHFMDSIIENRAYQLKDFIEKEGFQSVVISYNPGLYLKEAAALAGIGAIGKNNLLITEDYGAQVRLRAMVTNASLKVGDPINNCKYCENCTLCVIACPADALSDGIYDREKCFPYTQSHLKKLSDSSSIWCNKCIEACPIGKKRDKDIFSLGQS